MAEAEVFFDPKDKTHPFFDSIKEKELFLYDNEKELKVSVADAVKKKIINNQALAYYMYLTQEFLFTAGVDPKKFRFRKHAANELAHYAAECWDAELYSERFGWVECVGIADRSAYDLNAHIESSGVDMYALRAFEQPREVVTKKVVPKMNVLGPRFGGKAGKIKEQLEQMDAATVKKITVTIDGESIDIPKECYEIVDIKEKQTGEKFVPHVIEPSYGIDRILYFLLEHNYVEEKKKEDEYTILKLNPKVAPIKAGVFPLIGDENLIKIAKILDRDLRKAGISTFYDESGTIGRRYARMDEIGTPFCITIDHDSLNDNQVTVRNRDTTKQERIKIQDIIPYMKEKISL
jgi:glycyl-tRNA synthetase